MVLDANVLVRVVTPGDFAEQAEALWDQLLVSSRPCVVPAFCPIEVISSIRQMSRGGLLTPESEEEAIDEFVTSIQPALVTVDSPALTRTAWEIARQLNDRHTYDSVYLAVARTYGKEFWTLDRQLLRRLGGHFPEARFLGDYPLSPPAS